MSELVNTKLSVDLQILQDITARTWGKEDELKALKSELAPKHDEKDGEEVKRDEPAQHSNRTDVPSQSIGSKDSMVAEPIAGYQKYIRL